MFNDSAYILQLFPHVPELLQEITKGPQEEYIMRAKNTEVQMLVGFLIIITIIVSVFLPYK